MGTWPTILVVAIWKGFPFHYVNLLAGLQSIPEEVYDAASIDGASRTQTFFRITAPLLQPIAATVVLLNIIWTWNNFSFLWAFTGGGPAYRTTLLPQLAYVTTFQFHKFGYGYAIALVMFLIILPFTVVYLNRMSKTRAE